MERFRYSQQGNYDCFLAALMTVLQIDLKALGITSLFPQHFMDLIESKQGTYGETIDVVMQDYARLSRKDYWEISVPIASQADPKFKMMLHGRRALLQVPSLNHPGATHIVAWLGDELWDPSLKQRYQWLSQVAPQCIWIFNELKEKVEQK